MSTIVLIFDDNKYSHYSYVFPLLKKYGLSATFAYVTRGTFAVDNESAITEMKEYGIDITSHSHNHLKFDLDLHSVDKLRNEIHESEKKLSEFDISFHGIVMPFNYIKDYSIFDGIELKYVVYRTSTVNSSPFPEIPKIDNLSKFNFLRIMFPLETCPKDDTEKFYRFLKNMSEDEVIGIMFHNVSDRDIATNVKPSEFEKLLQFLVENQYNVVTLKSLYLD